MNITEDYNKIYRLYTEGKFKSLAAAAAIGAASITQGFGGQIEKIDPMELYSQIANHEGVDKSQYIDSEGHPSIGVGFNLDSRVNQDFLDRNPQIKEKIKNRVPLSKRDIQMLYNFSLTIAYKDAMSLFPNFQKLPKDVKKVLVDMSFNMGINKLSEFKNMRQAIIDGDFDKAADEMIDSKWYGQVKRRGRNLVGMMRSASTQ